MDWRVFLNYEQFVEKSDFAKEQKACFLTSIRIWMHQRDLYPLELPRLPTLKPHAHKQKKFI